LSFAYAALWLCDTVDIEKLKDFRRRFEEIDKKRDLVSEKEYYDPDEQFHRFLVESTGNQILIKLFDKIYQDHFRIRILTTRKNNKEKVRNWPEHSRIIDSFIAKDPEKIEKSIIDHLINSQTAAMKILI